MRYAYGPILTIDSRALAFQVVANIQAGGKGYSGFWVRNALGRIPNQQYVEFDFRGRNPSALAYWRDGNERVWLRELPYKGSRGRVEFSFDREGRTLQLTTPDNLTNEFTFNGNSLLRAPTREIQFGLWSGGGSDISALTPVELRQLFP